MYKNIRHLIYNSNFFSFFAEKSTSLRVVHMCTLIVEKDLSFHVTNKENSVHKNFIELSIKKDGSGSP